MTSPPIGAVARRTRTVSDRDIELFTEISGDRNPIHYDEEAAAASRFGGLVVQGGVTSGLLNAVVAEQLPGPGSVFLEVSWKFLAAVRPGDEITATRSWRSGTRPPEVHTAVRGRRSPQIAEPRWWRRCPQGFGGACRNLGDADRARPTTAGDRAPVGPRTWLGSRRSSRSCRPPTRPRPAATRPPRWS